MKKNYGGLLRLFALLVLLPLTAWTLGIAPTVARWREYRSERTEVRRLQMAQDTLGTSLGLSRDLLDSGDLLKLAFPPLRSGNIQVELYVPYLTQTRGSLALRSAEIVLRGEYIPLLQTISALERDVPQVTLRSVAFTSADDLREKKRHLRVCLIVQQLTRFQP